MRLLYSFGVAAVRLQEFANTGRKPSSDIINNERIIIVGRARNSIRVFALREASTHSRKTVSAAPITRNTRVTAQVNAEKVTVQILFANRARIPFLSASITFNYRSLSSLLFPGYQSNIERTLITSRYP